MLRDLTGWRVGGYWFPEIRSLGGAAVIFTLTLYPYVYLLARAAFLQQSAAALDVARTLGLGPCAVPSHRAAARPPGDRRRRRARR